MESHAELDRLIKKTEFGDFDSLKGLIDSILKVVDDNVDASEKKVPDKKTLYDYLFGLDYIDVSFKLKMANRSLEELSPGERGIVLLIFYLALNKNNTPIIIDQPEDNLDNQSVYSKLVPCICRAKRHRQVIIVTHNPNIAVACDAEQIIYCDMDKENHQHITYEAGSIKNDGIRKHVIDALEGTMPAFESNRIRKVLVLLSRCESHRLFGTLRHLWVAESSLWTSWTLQRGSDRFGETDPEQIIFKERAVHIHERKHPRKNIFPGHGAFGSAALECVAVSAG